MDVQDYYYVDRPPATVRFYTFTNLTTCSLGPALVLISRLVKYKRMNGQHFFLMYIKIAMIVLEVQPSEVLD